MMPSLREPSRGQSVFEHMREVIRAMRPLVYVHPQVGRLVPSESGLSILPSAGAVSAGRRSFDLVLIGDKLRVYTGWVMHHGYNLVAGQPGTKHVPADAEHVPDEDYTELTLPAGGGANAAAYVEYDAEGATAAVKLAHVGAGTVRDEAAARALVVDGPKVFRKPLAWLFRSSGVWTIDRTYNAGQDVDIPGAFGAR